ncbi:hypothetical protein DENSPDRAFT_106809 [Dentipellis sp. KUC8613]|nr:hypothetical protein DENSPDRAFT_106809 [Dentipellis sp. KUC8613]
MRVLRVPLLYSSLEFHLPTVQTTVHSIVPFACFELSSVPSFFFSSCLPLIFLLLDASHGTAIVNHCLLRGQFTADAHDYNRWGELASSTHGNSDDVHSRKPTHWILHTRCSV